MSGEISGKGDPPPLNMSSIRPCQDGIGDGVLLGAKIFREDWMAVPNDEHGSQNTPTSGHLGCALLSRARARVTPSRGLSWHPCAHVRTEAGEESWDTCLSQIS